MKHEVVCFFVPRHPLSDYPLLPLSDPLNRLVVRVFTTRFVMVNMRLPFSRIYMAETLILVPSCKQVLLTLGKVVEKPSVVSISSQDLIHANCLHVTSNNLYHSTLMSEDEMAMSQAHAVLANSLDTRRIFH